MNNVRYDYSSCHVDVPLTLAESIVEWGRSQVSDDDIFVTQRDPTFGREDDIHITILYGIHTESPDLIKDLLIGHGPVHVELGEISIFTNPYKFDVVMIEAFSDDLCRMNELLQSKVKFTNKYPVYNPHATVAYVKKGKGWKHKGVDLWKGKQFTCDYAVFSSKNGSKQVFSI